MEAKELREQLKGMDEKYYEVTVTLQVDDETEEDKTYFFRKPKTPSYDRYLKDGPDLKQQGPDGILPG